MGISESISRLAHLPVEYMYRLWFIQMGVDTSTSMCYWYPKIKDVLPTPKTIMLEVNKSEALILSKGKRPEELCARIIEAAGKIGYPVFIRTDLTSHKDDRENRIVWDEASLLNKVSKLIKYNLKRPQKNLRAIVFRQYISLYKGEYILPYKKCNITKERRYFVRDGKVLCHSAHWNFYRGGPEWGFITYCLFVKYRSMIRDINTETDDEVKRLTNMAEDFSKRVPDHMSLDFAMDENGEWFLLEANHVISSWHPDKRCGYHPLWFIQKTGREIDKKNKQT